MKNLVVKQMDGTVDTVPVVGVTRVLLVLVRRDAETGKNQFWVQENMVGKMPVTRQQYEAGPVMKKAIREPLRQLPDGCTIRCEVTGISRKQPAGLLLRWVASDWPGGQQPLGH